MDRKKYTSHFLLQNDAYRITISLSTIICVALLLIIESTFSPNMEFNNGWELHQAQSYLEIIPVMILSSLSGYAVGALSVLVFFSVETLSRHHFAYHAFVLLIASVIANLPIMRHWYKSIKKTLLACILFSLFLGNGWNILLAILEARDVSFEIDQFHFFVAVPSSVFVCAFCYLYFNFFPEKIRDLFFTSSYESEDVKRIKGMLSERKFRGIDEKLTLLLFFESFVIIFAGFGFANSLVDEFRITQWESIVFATRLTVLMSIVGVPVIMFTIANANQRLMNPIMLMAQAAEDSYVCNVESKDLCAGNPLIDLKSLGIESKDEIGILYEALCRAFENTNAYIANLEKEKQLETDLLSAKAASKAKSDFLSNMSHEIRTPINAVLGLDEMILRETTEDAIKKYAIDIESAGKSLLSIVNDILDFSKIEAGKMEIVSANYHVSSMVNDLVNMISKRARDKNLALNVDVDKSIPNLLFGDDVRIKQCILNILTNAVKYTKEGSVTLKVSAKKDGSQHILLDVSVTDTGIGIKEEDLPKLFTAFQRIEENKNRTIEGTGLGMNIVQNLLKLMDSKLEVQSVYGKGSTFSFSVRQRVADWTPVGDFNGIYERALEESAKYQEGFHAPNAKILVVDDTELNLTVVKGLLKQTKIQIDTANSGQETLELVAKKKYDIIFLDHRMPGMDGIETFHAMNELGANLNQGVPCIALTANATSSAKEMYLEAGFTDYLSKPIESKKLEAMILKYLDENLVEYTKEIGTDKDEFIVCEKTKARFHGVSGISLSDALKFTGGADVLEQTLKEFYNAIDQKATDIERFAAEKDWRNYTVLVHALKSSARLIGAGKLSADAAFLEKCGDRADEAEIVSKTPALLSDYRAYKNHLAALCAPAPRVPKSEISAKELDDALKSIKECAAAFDFDTLDTIMEMLDGYSLPSEREGLLKELKAAVRAVDSAKILEILG